MNWLFLHSFTTSAVSLLFSIVFSILYFQNRTLAAAKCWGIAYALLALATISIAVSFYLPDAVIPLTKSALLAGSALGYCFLYLGIKKWRSGNVVVTRPLNLTILAVVLCAGGMSAVWPATLKIAGTISLLFVLCFSAMAIWELLAGEKEKNIGHYLAAIFLCSVPIGQLAIVHLLGLNHSKGDMVPQVAPDLIGQPLVAVLYAIEPIGFAGIALFCLLGLLIDFGNKLRDESLRDWLTGCYNRRGFIEIANPQFSQSRRRNSRFSLMLIDLDNFKALNDNYGHDVGDVALREVAGILLGGVRGSDLVARWGGEEFIILLPEANAEEACMVADKLRRRIRQHKVQVASNEELFLSASFGVAERALGDKRIERMVSRADAALYRAKREGKNRVCAGEAS